MQIKNKDIRDVFFENYKKDFLADKKNFILTNDADVFSLKSLRNNKRFIDAGVAEQNLINIASGLAHSGKYPLIFGFCTFLTFRCYEQLKFNIGSHNCNVKVVGIGPGYSFPYDGPTHHGIQDIALMNLIPEFEIYNVSDNNLANLISKSLKKFKGPVYIRLEKGKQDYNLNIKYDLKKGFEYTKKIKNAKTLIIATGYTNILANELFEECKKFDVINFFKFKNFDQNKLSKVIKKYKKIIVYDENTYYGGISIFINSMIIKNNIKIKIQYLTSADKQIFIYFQDRNDFMKKIKIDKESLKRIL